MILEVCVILWNFLVSLFALVFGIFWAVGFRYWFGIILEMYVLGFTGLVLLWDFVVDVLLIVADLVGLCYFCEVFLLAVVGC